MTLLEELSLRTSKVIPLMKKLSSICNKMVELKNKLTDKPSRGRELSEDDRQAMTEEFEGMQDLVLEDPESLVRRCGAIQLVLQRIRRCQAQALRR